MLLEIQPFTRNLANKSFFLKSVLSVLIHSQSATPQPLIQMIENNTEDGSILLHDKTCDLACEEVNTLQDSHHRKKALQYKVLFPLSTKQSQQLQCWILLVKDMKSMSHLFLSLFLFLSLTPPCESNESKMLVNLGYFKTKRKDKRETVLLHFGHLA